LSCKKHGKSTVRLWRLSRRKEFNDDRRNRWLTGGERWRWELSILGPKGKQKELWPPGAGPFIASKR
jgi:hypothetical protein